MSTKAEQAAARKRSKAAKDENAAIPVLQAHIADPAATFMHPRMLVPWKDNPRINEHAVATVVKSITEFGFGDPIVARKADLMVISGHTRLKAALKMGLESVPVRLMDLSEVQARKLAIASNKIGEIATWDDDLLSKVLSDIKDDLSSLEMADLDPSTLGFTDLEFSALLKNPAAWAGEGGTGPDDIGNYNADDETFVIKTDKIKAKDRDAVLAKINAALEGTGYGAKAF